MRRESGGRLSGGITAALFQKTMVTMLIAELTGAATAVIDSVLTGCFLGGEALAAFGIGGPYFSIASIVSGLLMVGCTNRCTRAVGKGDVRALSDVFSLTLTLGAVISVLLGLSGFLFADGYARLFGAGRAGAAVYADTRAYLRGIFPGAPGFILFVILTPILQLDGDSTLPKIASAVSAFVDIAGDLLNIFVFKGGMLGMALASTFSHYAALAVTLTHFLKKGGMFRFSSEALRPRDVPPLLKDGLSRALCMFSRALLPILLNALALRVAGDAGVTALSARTGASFLLGALGWGIGGAVLLMGGMMAGEQNVSGLRIVVRTALLDVLAFVTAFAAVVFVIAPQIAALYVPEPGEVRDMARTALRCYALCLPLLALNVSASNYFLAVSRSLAANLVNVGIEVVFPAALTWLLCRAAGTQGLWWGFPAGQALLSLLLFARFALAKDGARSGVQAHMLLPPDFGVPPEDCIERSVHGLDDVVTLSQEVFGFCAAHGIGRREANRLALCIEELAGNVIEHGFRDGKPHRLDLRVLVKEGRVTLRMRDDCELFDLKQKAASWAPDPEHPEKGIGIRLVMASASDIVYSASMNTNNLIITI